MAPSERGPGVRFPPPFVFLAGFGVAWWLDTRLEFLISGAGPGRIQLVFGSIAAAAGLSFMFWGLVTFARARTAVIPNRRARAFVRTGPYRFSRNPMYVGLSALYLGASLLTNMAWPLVLFPFVLVALTTLVIRREEAYLRAEFGADYEAYQREVRRWL